MSLHLLASGDAPSPLVDIIAIHGLNPKGKDPRAHAWDTWRKPKGDKGHLWLQDDLPIALPRARIFLYQYDSRVIFGGLKGTFLDTANGLLEDLLLERIQDPKRPLILLGHSLGGLLIKQALVNAHDNDRYADIIASVRSIVFFGTPHEGGNATLVKIGATSARIAKCLGYETSDSLVEILKSGSLFADTLKESFRHQLERYTLVSFWEGLGDIVSKDSATFGLPGTRENILRLEADHGGICRFDPAVEQDQINYKRVKGNLSILYTKAVSEGESLRQPSSAQQQSLEERFRALQQARPA